MNWYPWLTPAYNQLMMHYLSLRRHHALLLQVHDGCGDDQLVKAISRRIMCRQASAESKKACGVCHHCRLMDAGNHPDWHVLVAEKNKSSIGVEQIRQLTAILYEHAQQSSAKIVWIPQAELMTEAAANALLKTLEEPTKETFFILTCRDSGQLLPTIRSRCLFWHLASPAENLGLAWLKKQLVDSHVLPDASLSTALRLTQGAPLAALKLLEEDNWKQRQVLCERMQHEIQNHALLMLLSELNQDNAADYLYWISTLFLDALKYQQQVQTFIINQDQLPLIKHIAKVWPDTLTLQQLARKWLEQRQKLFSVQGINRELLLADLLSYTEQSIDQIQA